MSSVQTLRFISKFWTFFKSSIDGMQHKNCLFFIFDMDFSKYFENFEHFFFQILMLAGSPIKIVSFAHGTNTFNIFGMNQFLREINSLNVLCNSYVRQPQSKFSYNNKYFTHVSRNLVTMAHFLHLFVDIIFVIVDGYIVLYLIEIDKSV